ncbi:MAG: Gfo/Idh/MocA family oxidoreductase [Bacteroidales bacterium]|nr:Gfo/Idh/MocA family oxidoreductase [Bacteroidales bacterium]
MNDHTKFSVAIIGFGRMGELFYDELKAAPETWNILYICDSNAETREYAKNLSPNSIVIADDTAVFEDERVDVVVLTALADSRKDRIDRALKSNKHVISEKPISDTVEKEWQIVDEVENSCSIVAVNLPLRNAWHNIAIKNFINSGEIGDLAIIRVCSMTPGLAPGEGHLPEGPAFHDCGMHYVDITKWFADSDYHSWHAQAVRMWNYKEPWWLQCHGTFENGVVFDITQGHVYGQLAKDLIHNSYIDIIGTKGIARISHDYHDAVVELHGVNHTEIIKRKYGDKNIDVLCDLFAQSLKTGIMDKRLPTVRDAAIGSLYAWKFLEDAKNNVLPSIGSLSTLEEIKLRRSHLKNGYGISRRKK